MCNKISAQHYNSGINNSLQPFRYQNSIQSNVIFTFFAFYSEEKNKSLYMSRILVDFKEAKLEIINDLLQAQALKANLKFGMKDKNRMLI